MCRAGEEGRQTGTCAPSARAASARHAAHCGGEQQRGCRWGRKRKQSSRLGKGKGEDWHLGSECAAHVPEAVVHWGRRQQVGMRRAVCAVPVCTRRCAAQPSWSLSVARSGRRAARALVPRCSGAVQRAVCEQTEAELSQHEHGVSQVSLPLRGHRLDSL